MPTPLGPRLLAVSVAALLLAILAGCSPAAPASSQASPRTAASSIAVTGTPSASASAGAASAPLACDLVTTAMIQAALGTTVVAGTSKVSDLGGSTCDFKDAGIFVRLLPDKDAAFVQGMKGSFKGSVDLPGVGAAAFYSQENATFMVLKGTTVVQVQAPNQNDQAKLLALATAIVAKL